MKAKYFEIFTYDRLDDYYIYKEEDGFVYYLSMGRDPSTCCRVSFKNIEEIKKLEEYTNGESRLFNSFHWSPSSYTYDYIIKSGEFTHCSEATTLLIIKLKLLGI